MDRRSFVIAAAASTLLRRIAPRFVRPAPSRTGLILLGTAGGPRPRKQRSAPAQVIVVDGVAYVVDCGNGVARQLVRAGVPLPSIRHVFVTHHHSDHNADYGTLLLLAWSAGLKTRVDTWGPPPLARMTELAFELNAVDIRARTADEGRVPLAPLVHPHELTAAGRVLRDERVTVTAALVDHPPIAPAFAYRFDTADRSIVISGDTRRSDALIELSRGADVLVHEALYPAGIDRLVGAISNASDLKRSIISHHTSIEDVGRVAQAAGVKRLVLSHLVPAEDPAISDEMWIGAARAHYGGPITVGADLMEV
ncbi:MAG TPA: MBL fold metallo-hydrolase [Gemmatimonadales bacterium]|nr:MBL fold metallo-hydrolase [Gemmatimonadales bacterium]